MRKNPSYEDHTPVYEEIQLQDKAAETTDVIVKPNERISSSFANKTKTNLQFVYIAVVVVFSMVAIAMVAVIALSVRAGVDSNQGMDSLMKEIQELKMQLNETKKFVKRRLQN